MTPSPSRTITAYIALITLVATACASGSGASKDDTHSTETASGQAPSTSGPEHERQPEPPPAPELPTIDAFQTKLAFTPSISEGTISALDLESNTVAWTLKVSEGTDERPAESAMGIAATRDGKTIFSGDAATDEIVIVDAETRKIKKRIPVDHQVHAIDICPHDHWVFVSGRLKDYPWLSKTTILKVEDLSKAGEMSPGLGYSAHFAFTPDGGEAWAASVSTNQAWVVDVMSQTVTDVIPLVPGNLEGASPEAKLGLIGLNEVAISPDGRRAFLVGPEAGMVFAVDVHTRELVGSKKVGERTHGVAVTRDGREVWTANNTGTVTILDTETLDVIGEVEMRDKVGDLSFAHVAFSLDGKRAYLAWEKDITVIDVASREVVATIPVGTGPHEISLEDFYVRSTERVTGKAEHQQTQEAETADDYEKTSRAAGVTVKATLKRDEDGTLGFPLALDTHSGDLMGYDIASSAVVRVNGEVVTSEMTWTADAESSHHRKGVLTTSAPAPASGTAVVLELPDLSGATHTLKWGSK